MKINISLSLLAIAFSVSCFSQKLTLSDLLAIGNKQNWESVNTFLSSKGWDYYDSNKGDTYQLSEITWSFNKERYSNEAMAWLHLFTFDKAPNKILYSVFNKPSYEIIQKSLTGSGFKLLDSEIEDNSITNNYSNNTFFLKIITEKREDDAYSISSTTAYSFLLIKKGGFYDEANGKRYDYYEDGSLNAEYNLKNGLIDGIVNVYHENGKLKKTCNYTKGLANGIVKEYDESGFLIALYKTKNGKTNGLLTIYKDNHISQEIEKLDNLNNGKFVDYYYEGNTLVMKIVGGFIQDKMNGKWETFLVNNGQEELYNYTNYIDDIKDGAFMEYNISGDTLEIGSYRNGKLHGNYTRKIGQKVFSGEDIEETTMWNIDCQGLYKDGLREGEWTEYFYGIKKQEGYYKNGLKTGTWNEFVTMGKKSGEIKSTVEYMEGKKDGLTRTYYQYDLSPISIQGSSSQTILNIPVNEITTYKNDFKSGDYSLRDSTGKLLLTGYYYNDKKNNSWKEYFANNYSTSSEYKDNYKLNVSYYDDDNHLYLKESYLNDEISRCDYYNNNKIIETHDLQSQKDGYLVNVVLFKHGTQDTISRTDYKVYSTEEYNYNLFRQYGIKEGDYQLLVNNQKIVEGKFCNNLRCGNWIFDHLLEDIYIIRFFREDVLIEERYFDNKTKELYSGRLVLTENGNKLEIKIKKGFRSGKSLTYNKDGKIILEEKYEDGQKVEK